MNHHALKSLDRALAEMEERRKRSNRRLTTSPFLLSAGLFLNVLLLVRLVPLVWPALLGGDPEGSLRGWPLQVWRASGFCVGHMPGVVLGVVAASFLSLFLNYRFRVLRPLTWLSAVLVVLVDAGIVWATIQACLQESGVSI